MDFSLKPISFFGRTVAIVCQNENGPCPLLALANILLLEGRITINPDRGIISLAELTQIVANCILEKIGTSSLPEHIKLLESVLNILPKLANGLDLNVIFSGVDKFEFTEEISVFDALGIRLLHGWIYDSKDTEIVTAVGNLSYNHLLFHLVEYKSLCEKRKQPSKLTDVSNNLSERVDAADVNAQEQIEVRHQDVEKEQNLMKEGAIFEKFLEATAPQFTYPGMLSLYSTMHDRQFAVFFRNNHFSTLFFYNGQLFMLVTDLGYRHESAVMWEVLDSIDGATEFYNAEFIPLSSLPPRTPIDYTQLFAADNVANGLSAEEDSNAVMSPLQSSAAGHVGAAGGTFASPPSDAKYMYGTRASLPVVSRTTSGVAVPTHQVDGDPIHNAAPPPVEDSSTATAVQSKEITEDFEIVDKPVTDASTPFSEADARIAEGLTIATVTSVEDIPVVNTDASAPSSGPDDTTILLPSSSVPIEDHLSVPLPDTAAGADRQRTSSVDADFLLAIQLQEEENELATAENNNNNNSSTIPATTVPSDHLHPSAAVPGRMASMMTQEESDREHALRLHYEEMNALNHQQQQQNSASSTGRSQAYTTFAASQSGGFPYNQSREQQPSAARSPRSRPGTASTGQKKDICIIS